MSFLVTIAYSMFCFRPSPPGVPPPTTPPPTTLNPPSLQNQQASPNNTSPQEAQTRPPSPNNTSAQPRLEVLLGDFLTPPWCSATSSWSPNWGASDPLDLPTWICWGWFRGTSSAVRTLPGVLLLSSAPPFSSSEPATRKPGPIWEFYSSHVRTKAKRCSLRMHRRSGSSYTCRRYNYPGVDSGRDQRRKRLL